MDWNGNDFNCLSSSECIESILMNLYIENVHCSLVGSVFFMQKIIYKNNHKCYCNNVVIKTTYSSKNKYVDILKFIGDMK